MRWSPQISSSTALYDGETIDRKKDSEPHPRLVIRWPGPLIVHSVEGA